MWKGELPAVEEALRLNPLILTVAGRCPNFVWTHPSPLRTDGNSRAGENEWRRLSSTNLGSWTNGFDAREGGDPKKNREGGLSGSCTPCPKWNSKNSAHESIILTHISAIHSCERDSIDWTILAKLYLAMLTVMIKNRENCNQTNSSIQELPSTAHQLMVYGFTWWRTAFQEMQTSGRTSSRSCAAAASQESSQWLLPRKRST